MNWLRLLARYLSWIGIGLGLVIMLYILTDVIGRFLLGKPARGCEEIASLLIVIVGGFFVTSSEVYNRHIRTTILSDRFPFRLRAWLDSFYNLLASGVLGLVTWRVIVSAMFAWQTREITNVLLFPTAPFRFVFAFGLAVFTLYLFLEGVWPAVRWARSLL